MAPNTIPFPEVFSKIALRIFDDFLHMKELVKTDLTGEMARFGDRINVDKFSDLTTQSYVRGTDLTQQNVTVTRQTLVIDQQKAVLFHIDEIETVEHQLDLINGSTQRAIQALAEDVEDNLLARFVDVDSGNIEGSDASPITVTEQNAYELFSIMGEKLDDSNIPMKDRRAAVIDPKTWRLLRNSPQLIHATDMGDEVLRRGVLGQVAGFDIFLSNRIVTTAGVKNLMFFIPDFIDLVVRISENNVRMFDPEKQFGTGVKSLALWGTKVFQPEAGAVLKIAA